METPRSKTKKAKKRLKKNLIRRTDRIMIGCLLLEMACLIVGIFICDSMARAAEAQIVETYTSAPEYSVPINEFISNELEMELNTIEEPLEIEEVTLEVPPKMEEIPNDIMEAPSREGYTQEDIELLANVMYLEEGIYVDEEFGEYIHKLAGSVVLHRVKHPVFPPDTIEGIVYQKGQYGPRTLRLIGKTEIPDIVYVWAEDLLRDGPIGPDNLVFQAGFKQGNEVYYQYKNQYFCLY